MSAFAQNIDWNHPEDPEWALKCSLTDLFKAAGKEVVERWQPRLNEALKFCNSRRGRKSEKKAVLIEVAAQHPLADGIRPGTEFQARLDKAIELYHQCRKSGRDVEIYVPGSRHMINGIEDKVTLSAAGVSYLFSRGLPAEILHGDDLNDRYKGIGSGAPHQGVYCGADECFVTSRYYKDNEKFGLLFCVASPIQAQRKRLHYVDFEVRPRIITAQSSSYFHIAAREVGHNLLDVLKIKPDPSFQKADTQIAFEFRRDRWPGYTAAQNKAGTDLRAG